VASFISDVFFIRFDGAMDVARAVVEIAIFAYFIYVLLKLVRDTRAWQLSKGILLILVITAFSNLFELKSLSFVLNNTFSVMAIGVLIIFQPELRRGLEQIGRSSLKDFFATETGNTETIGTIDALVKACSELSKTYTGALIVVEKETKIGDIISTGIAINSSVTAELLINIFTPNTPLHDGAVVIRDNRIKAATCYLPLSENAEINKELGTRHRAAIGVTEGSDALAIVVSEETGMISLIQDGAIQRGLSPEALKAALWERMPEMAAQPKILPIFAPKPKAPKPKADRRAQKAERKASKADRAERKAPKPPKAQKAEAGPKPAPEPEPEPGAEAEADRKAGKKRDN
jgi:diadenylate cyclase